MEILWIIVAFAFGLLARLGGLPPMVGFLIAGFILNIFDIQRSNILEEIADMGIMLLLFTIGVKLRIRSLFRPEVYGGTLLSLLIMLPLMILSFMVLSWWGIPMIKGLTVEQMALISFALSFSSTVFVIKVLDDKGGMYSLHGRVSVGVLIIQDIVAVAFLTVAQGKMPTIYAALLLLLPFIRPVLSWILDKSGHGELLVLCGLLIAFSGAYLFEWVNLKPDLGALVFGMLLSNDKKADELSKSLLQFKDFFLIAFFLLIGLDGEPTFEMLLISFLLIAFMPLKLVLFQVIFTRFRLRARTAFISSSLLTNYSEFGLIVGGMAVANNWLPAEWLLIMALAISVSFIVSSPVNVHSYGVYSRLEKIFGKWERPVRLKDDTPVDTGDARILIFGMGRLGEGVYDFMKNQYGDNILGLDADPKVVESNQMNGRKVVLGDATDSDFWEKLRPGKVQLVVLAMTKHEANKYAARRFADSRYTCFLAATANYPDQIAELKELGVKAVYNIYHQAGIGFGEHIWEEMEGVCIKDGHTVELEAGYVHYPEQEEKN